jgi:5'-nucleotidase
MEILVTNDDGIDAPGIHVLIECLQAFGNVTVVAPDRHVSGCGHQMTLDRPVRLHRRRHQEYACDGLPADCVRIGLSQIVQADLVVAGVNDGGNLGADTFVSGTVAASREACMHGCNTIAFSQYRLRGSERKWEETRRLTKAVLDRLLVEPDSNFFWNVNFPERSSEGKLLADLMTFCPLDVNSLPAVYESLPDGFFAYRGVYHDRTRSVGSDVDVCFNGGIAITSLLPPKPDKFDLA